MSPVSPGLSCLSCAVPARARRLNQFIRSRLPLYARVIHQNERSQAIANDPRSRSEVAAAYGISLLRVSQIRAKYRPKPSAVFIPPELHLTQANLEMLEDYQAQLRKFGFSVGKTSRLEIVNEAFRYFFLGISTLPKPDSRE